MFYCEFCEISKNTCFTEHLWTTACEFITETLIFGSSRSHTLFKVSILKNFAMLEPLSNNKPSFTEHLRWLLLNFCGSKYFFVAEYGIYCWQLYQFRSSHQRCSVRKGALRNFAKLTGKHKCQSLYLIKLQAFCSGLLFKHKLNLRSSRWSCSVKKVFLENLQILQENSSV